MGIPANVGKTVIKGTGIGGEIWQTGFWWQTVTGGALASLADFTDIVTDQNTPIQGFWGTIKAQCFTGYAWTGYTSYWYDGGATAKWVVDKPTAAVAGTLATNGSPADTCLCVSLISDTAGRRGRGRMYLPRHTAVSPTTGMFVADASYAVNALAALFHNTILATHPSLPRVVSQADSVARSVSQLKGNSLPDVQRRRENKMGPGTVTTVLSPF